MPRRKDLSSMYILMGFMCSAIQTAKNLPTKSIKNG